MSTTQGKNARQDADTKRSDFLRKVSEMFILFAFKTTLIFFSPSSKAHRSGHSSVDANIGSHDNLKKLIVQEITCDKAKIWIIIKKLFEEYADLHKKKLKAANFEGSNLNG
ncbi:hypothetical protein V6N13_053431 [Hibiscus sabdariffa]